MRLALDSNAYTDYVRGVPARVQAVQFASELLFPVIVLGELLSGFRMGKQAAANESALQLFLRSPRASILPADQETAKHYSYLTDLLRRQGTPIPTNDIWIAAIVQQHGLVLCTSDTHFRHVPHLPTC
ncbi:type II toxin-antitoxin system VapC family toxin [Planctomicrobium sp. SH661]|uniref:type II toxin-antitoxin system VapC family toxin n=1 Tax=Planctomicrobium sp. SH661 TaxID=3448124 RepID=UPI003F5C3435